MNLGIVKVRDFPSPREQNEICNLSVKLLLLFAITEV